MNVFLTEGYIIFLATLTTSIIGWFFIELLDGKNKQKEFVATLLALQNECQYNEVHRGNERSQFRIFWLEKSLENLELYNQFEEITQDCLAVFELAPEANSNQLQARKMVPRDVQDKFSLISKEIEKKINILRKRTSTFGFIKWKLFKI